MNASPPANHHHRHHPFIRFPVVISACVGVCEWVSGCACVVWWSIDQSIDQHKQPIVHHHGHCYARHGRWPLGQAHGTLQGPEKGGNEVGGWLKACSAWAWDVTEWTHSHAHISICLLHPLDVPSLWNCKTFCYAFSTLTCQLIKNLCKYTTFSRINASEFTSLSLAKQCQSARQECWPK